ncbi:MAG TPA: hypothetical protein VII47_14875 [Actinomycetota bacterium]
MDEFRTVPTRPALEEDLRALVRLGLPGAREDQLPGLFGLPCVRQEIRADGGADHLLA